MHFQFQVEKEKLEYVQVKLSQSEFAEAQKFGQYALDVYGAVWAWLGDEKAAANKMALKPDDQVLMTWFHDQDSGELNCPKFMIFTDEESNSIVLAIRGTNR